MSALPPQGPQASPQAGTMGTSPATQPVPNRGMEAVATQGVALIVRLMGELVPKSASNQELQSTLMDCMKKLGKFSSGASPQAGQSQMRDLMMQQQKMAQLPQQAKPPGA
jgi:hypothetical protein